MPGGREDGKLSTEYRGHGATPMVSLLVLWQTSILRPLQAIKAQQLELERGTEGFFRKVQNILTPNARVRTRDLHTAWEQSPAQYRFPKWQCSGTRSYPLTYSAWVWQQPNCGAVREHLRPSQPKVFTFWLIAGKSTHCYYSCGKTDT